MKDTFKPTFEVLKAATMAIRADYIARYTEMEMAQLVKDRAGLAAVGMDAEKYAPYPKGSMNKTDYRRGKANYDRVRCYFTGTSGRRTFHGPNIVAENPDAEPRLRATAVAAANNEVDSYLWKMAAKIGKVITEAKTNGNIWDFAYLDVVCEDGEEQRWKTQCILNRSVYNKVFNQWPTRRYA